MQVGKAIEVVWHCIGEYGRRSGWHGGYGSWYMCELLSAVTLLIVKCAKKRMRGTHGGFMRVAVGTIGKGALSTDGTSRLGIFVRL